MIPLAMCGRFVLIRLSEFTDLFPWIRPADIDSSPRYNIAPSQAVAVVPNKPEPQVDFFHWGLIPSWARDPAIGNRMINARAESLADKPAFRSALRRRRCLVPASGFYEWRRNPDGTRAPMHIRLNDGMPFAFGGLWETWHAPDGSVVSSFTIITTQPNDLLKDIHDRMPLIVDPADYREWLEPGEIEPSKIEPLLRPYPADRMMAHPVSQLVNSPRNDSPQCIEAITQEAAPPQRQKPKHDDLNQGRLF